MSNLYEQSAKKANLKYVCDDDPGFIRKRKGKGFVYINSKGKQIKKKKTIERFKSLVIPPAWEEVWICPSEEGHIQVTGRDSKGRKQYIYHSDWENIRNEKKFHKLADFGKCLPEIRKTVKKDLRKKSLCREKVLAIVVRLLEETMIRVGNSEYAKRNKSYGLTTLHDKHIKVNGTEIKFSFKGKSGKDFDIDVRDKQLAKMVKDCQDIPGQHLFQYYEENGSRIHITSGDVNGYLSSICNNTFTAKDFRTWGGTVIAADEFFNAGKPENEKAAHKNIVQVVKDVADALNNTPAICREYYIHPDIIDAYKNGDLFAAFNRYKNRKSNTNLDPEEKAVLSLLKISRQKKK